MNTFQTQYLATIGASFLEKEIKIDDKEITFQFWDTAGAEKFRTLTKLFYKGSSCCLVLYDITLRRTFDKVEAWTHEFRESSNQINHILLIVGNKIDLENQRVVLTKEGEELAKKCNAHFFEISVKDDPDSLNKMFNIVGKDLIELKRRELQSNNLINNETVRKEVKTISLSKSPPNNPSKINSKSCCC